MDINAISAVASVQVPLRHPASQKLVGIVFTLRPPSDPVVKAAKRAQMNKRLQSRKQKVTAESLEASAIEILLAATENVEFVEDDEGQMGSLGGEQPEFSPALVRRLLSADWIRDQLDEALGDEGSFFKE